MATRAIPWWYIYYRRMINSQGTYALHELMCAPPPTASPEMAEFYGNVIDLSIIAESAREDYKAQNP